MQIAQAFWKCHSLFAGMAFGGSLLLSGISLLSRVGNLYLCPPIPIYTDSRSFFLHLSVLCRQVLRYIDSYLLFGCNSDLK